MIRYPDVQSAVGRVLIVSGLVSGLALCAGCGEEDEVTRELPAVSSRDLPAKWDPDASYSVAVTPGDLSSAITHAHFPAPVGATWTYQGQTEDGMERVEIEVLAETHEVMGMQARVVRDTVYLEGELIEDTWDWYGQDAAGNVWYLGEDTYEYEDGEVLCSCGSWEWGKDVASRGSNALPGVVMLAEPRVGDAYRQEYYAGEAEDLAEVVEVGVAITVTAGSFTGCVKTRDLSVLDVEAQEYKVYCPGVGVVFEEDILEGTTVELISYSMP